MDCCSPVGEVPPDAGIAEDLAPIDFGDDRLDATQRAVRSAGFLVLLAGGEAAPIVTIAEEAGVPLGTVDEGIRRLAEQGSAHLDSGGKLLGIAGLSVEPTRHAVLLPQGKRWTWCALDAVGIVGAVGAGTITSRAPDGTVGLTLHDGGFRPEGLAIFLADGYGMTSSLGQWCPLVDFFPSVGAAHDWAREHGVSGRGVPVTELSAIATDRWRAIIERRSATGSRSGA